MSESGFLAGMLIKSARLGIEPACLAGSEGVTIDRARVSLRVGLRERRYLSPHGTVEGVEIPVLAGNLPGW